ncbi:7179_t:CDS:1 [Paraglomus brasilianum]|uniref:7179_t:CDS:1 n=1 Tax=Paraglomus brasilianum TaxID=144538 RepID=A0A9N9AUU3_9GLOM|nr:7179_t:CDS:1 [Paraglomus brasilianum]
MVLFELISDFKIVIFSVFFVIALLKLRDYLKWRKSADNIPGPSASLLTGNMLDIGRAGGLFFYLHYLHKIYGPVVKYWAAPNELHVTINDPDILEQLSIQTTERPLAFVEFLKGFFGNRGLIYLTGQSAKERRLIWHKVFAKRPYEAVIARFCEIINKRSTEWLMRRKDGETSVTIDIQAESRFLWNKLNDYNVFGNSASSESLSAKFEEAIEVLLQIRYRFTPVLPYTQLWHRKRALLEDVRREVDRLIKEQLQNRGGAKPTGSDLLSILLNDEELDEESFFDEVLTLLFVVTDNFMGVATFLHQIALHKHIQERIRKEIQDVLGDKTLTSLDDLTRLTYVRAVVKETLRYGGTSNITLRTIDKDYLIKNKYFIPKDAFVVIPIRVLHRNSDYWSNPDKFDPDRFMENGEKFENRPRMAYVPFGFGSRSCLGQRYVMNTLTLIACSLVRKFDIDAVTKEDEIIWKAGIFSEHSANGIWLNFTPRNVE